MENSFIVSPMKQDIALKAGETYEGSILVVNPADAKENFNYKITVNPYSVSGDDYKADFVTVSDWSKIVEWIEIDQPLGTLAPNESKRIYFKIKVPESVPSGGQYAMIGVSPVLASSSDRSEIHDIYTMGSLIYAKMDGETIHKGEILDNYVPSFVSSGIPTTVVTVENNGNVHEILSVKLKVKNIFTGQELNFTDQEENKYESTIMPESTRVVSRELKDMPGLGLFQVTQDVSYIGESSYNETILLICPIWFIVLVFVTILAIIATIGILIFKKHQKSSKKQLQFE